jgi:hypothetical protein
MKSRDVRRERAQRIKFTLTAFIVLILALGVGLGGVAAGEADPAEPSLGLQVLPGTTGLGEVQPEALSTGNGPRGLVRHIRWIHWGGKRAVAWGVGFYVWPGRSIIDGSTARARVVAFDLGMCKGRLAYRALEWYFPKYGGRFDGERYFDACAGRFVGTSMTRTCPGKLETDAKSVTSIKVKALTCDDARMLITGVPVSRYLRNGGRFIHRGFRCGSMGIIDSTHFAAFECERRGEQASFSVSTVGVAGTD